MDLSLPQLEKLLTKQRALAIQTLFQKATTDLSQIKPCARGLVDLRPTVAELKPYGTARNLRTLYYYLKDLHKRYPNDISLDYYESVIELFPVKAPLRGPYVKDLVKDLISNKTFTDQEMTALVYNATPNQDLITRCLVQQLYTQRGIPYTIA